MLFFALTLYIYIYTALSCALIRLEVIVSKKHTNWWSYAKCRTTRLLKPWQTFSVSLLVILRQIVTVTEMRSKGGGGGIFGHL